MLDYQVSTIQESLHVLNAGLTTIERNLERLSKEIAGLKYLIADLRADLGRGGQ